MANAPAVEQPRVPGAVTAATVAALGNQASTSLGQMALNLALRIDNGASGVGLVALVREHRLTMAEALKLVPPFSGLQRRGRTGRRAPRRRPL